jgi:hypothetical protein
VNLAVLEGAYAVCRLGASVPAPPPPVSGSGFWSLTCAGGERSLVCAQDAAPPAENDTIIAGGWRILQVEGPMDLGLTGVMASLSAPLAEAGVPIFPVATHDTDWILVPGSQLEGAVSALRAAGHQVR